MKTMKYCNNYLNWQQFSNSKRIVFAENLWGNTVVDLLHTDYLSTPSLSPSLKLHCITMTAIFTENDHFFKPEQIDWKRLICSAFNQNGQVWKKWSCWVKIVVIAMQCNAILIKGTSLVRINPCLSQCKLLVKQ